jgi:hypothetical protein
MANRTKAPVKRRSFLKRLAQAAVIIGLAPRLAFRVPDETDWSELEPWFFHNVEMKAIGGFGYGLYDFIMSLPEPALSDQRPIARDDIPPIKMCLASPEELQRIFSVNHSRQT